MGAELGSSGPFIGRHETVELLHRRFGEARAGSGGVTLLLGDAGVGKSMLIDELTREVRTHGVPVLLGRAPAVDDPPPFSLLPLSSQTVSVKPGSSTRLSFEFQGSSSSPVQLKFSDSETVTAIPTDLNATSSGYQFLGSLTGTRFTLDISANAALAPGTYIFDVTATDGAVAYTVFIHVDVS